MLERISKFLKPSVPPIEIDDTKLLDLIEKGVYSTLSPSWYNLDHVKIANEQYGDINDTEALRRAIHTISNYYNTLGVYRSDFDKKMNDSFAANAYYSICEKAMMDYVSILDWGVIDSENNKIESAMDFLAYPNPQDSFSTLMKQSLRDLIRYDAGVWVKSFSRGGNLLEMKAYLGTEFWKEMDRIKASPPIPYTNTTYDTYWSRGFTRMYWQRSQSGLYIPYQPEEICYFMMYPRSDSVYGTDQIKNLKYQLQYLIDSTRAAGKTFENGLVPSIVWEHPDVIDRQTLYERIKQTTAANQGSYKFGGVLHTVSNEKVSTLASKLIDMQWLEGQKFVASLVWAMWGFSIGEFLESDVSRATAYVSRNITKSRMLYPILEYYEQVINKQVLPYLKGYKKDWKFKFIRDVELDDEQKISQINATKATTFVTYLNAGIDPVVAARLANIGDDLTTEEVENIESLADLDMDQEMGVDENYQSEEVDQGRYTDDNYSPINFSDYGQGKQEDRSNQIGENDSDERMEKARIYIASPNEAPSGADVRRGGRGGYYYISKPHTSSTSGKEDTKTTDNSAKRKRTASRSSPKPTKPMEIPDIPDVEPRGKIRITGESVDIIIAERNGKLIGYTKNSKESKDIAKVILSNASSKEFKDVKQSAMKVAEENNLKVN